MYKIMIIEDDSAMSSAMKKQIESWGNEVHCIPTDKDHTKCN